ncbi:hypothetical protein Q6670_004073 [Salmonella enterica]|nr:hypothetical protein [Salmonella enterica]
MPINANAQGVVQGSFTIPKGIKAGTKQVQFFGDPSNAKQQSNAETTFTGQGTVVTNTMRKVNNVMSNYYDPLAQTFMLNEPRQLSGVRVWVETKGTTPLIVQLRETTVGFPTRTIVAEGQLEVTDASYIQGGWVTVHFDVPFYASKDIEYAVVVLANDADTAVGISELGKLDPATNTYVTSQPYQVGVLLSSANATTWTAHQDKDLTFELLARRYTGTTKTKVLGVVQLPANTSDILVSALTTTPATGADADLKLEIFDGNNKSFLTRMVSDGQVVKLDTALPTQMEMVVTANLRCTPTASATISPGTQIIAGVLSGGGDYITRGIQVGKRLQGAKQNLTVTLETNGGGSVKVFYGDDDSANTGKPVQTWHDMSNVPSTQPQQPVITALSNGNSEYVWTALDIAQMDVMKLKITLGGSPAERKQVFNLRASISAA